MSRVVEGLRCGLPDLITAGYLLTYRPMVGEIDLDPLLHLCPCAVTRTWPQGRLTVHSADVEMEQHRWGYLQPVATASELPLDDIGAVLVPGVLFDRFGGRLGHGAGYYDRLLPRLRSGIAVVGVVTEDRVFDRVPTDAHDVCMTHLATEAGVRAVEL
jgi:5-formyltetrahydrofolate cyclo-ligase